MAWFRKEKKPRQPRRERLEIPPDVWEKCEACGHTDIGEKFARNFNVCPNCDYHRRIRAIEYCNILLDGDTGYGNFNSARRLVTKLEQRGVAGVCIEDKLFPKTNSFIRGTAQPLADMHEFAGKIRAMKEAQRDEDFVVVARVVVVVDVGVRHTWFDCGEFV